MSIGLDWSMTCPAACCYTPEKVSFWYAHGTKGDAGIPDVSSVYIPEGLSVSKRAAFLAQTCIDWLRTTTDDERVMIEGYAFGASGLVFHIGENTGILKFVLDDAAIEYTTVPPTVVKKFGTGKGNADKHKMVSAFLGDYPLATTWITRLFPRYKEGQLIAKSPLSDLADAYWIAKYMHSKG